MLSLILYTSLSPREPAACASQGRALCFGWHQGHPGQKLEEETPEAARAGCGPGLAMVCQAPRKEGHTGKYLLLGLGCTYCMWLKPSQVQQWWSEVKLGHHRPPPSSGWPHLLSSLRHSPGTSSVLNSSPFSHQLFLHPQGKAEMWLLREDWTSHSPSC